MEQKLGHFILFAFFSRGTSMLKISCQAQFAHIFGQFIYNYFEAGYRQENVEIIHLVCSQFTIVSFISYPWQGGVKLTHLSLFCASTIKGLIDRRSRTFPKDKF